MIISLSLSLYVYIYIYIYIGPTLGAITGKVEDKVKIRTALVSVFDKTGIEELGSSDSLRGSSVQIGTIQRRLGWPLRKDDTHKSRSVNKLIEELGKYFSESGVHVLSTGGTATKLRELGCTVQDVCVCVCVYSLIADSSDKGSDSGQKKSNIESSVTLQILSAVDSKGKI